MKYYAMIDGEQRGPFLLEELPLANVRPDTYVWCKGMKDWQRAEDVADICRFYRCRIFDMMHPSEAQANQPQQEEKESAGDDDDPYAAVPLKFRWMVRKSGMEPPPPVPENRENHDLPPMSMMVPAIFLTIFCFPPTGFIAIYYSYMASRSWIAAEKSSDQNEKERLRKEAHNHSRNAKMWTGITFFLGLILIAFIGHKTVG